MTSEDTAPKADNGSTLEANLVDPGLETEGNRKSPAEIKTPCCSGLKAFLAALAFAYFSKVFSGAIMKGSFTQLERRFGISSSTAGFMDTGFEIGNLMTIAFVSYFGAKFHRPRVIALGCFVMSLGSFLAALPHFFMGPYNYDTLSKVSSNSTSRISPCSASQTGLEVTEMLGPGCENEVTSNTWIYVFMGNLLRGIGETPVTPLGISYLDDFSREEDAPFYIGCLHTIGMIGPIAGFLLGSQLAKLYVDIGSVDLGTVTITPTDSRWVGAWWMGFLLAGVFNLISGIPFCFLPKSLHREDKNSSEKEKTDNEKSHNDANRDQKAEVQLEENCTEKMKGFFVSLKKVLGNRMYFALMCVSILQFNSFIGFITYNRKYMEQQYGIPASKSNFIMGVMVLPVTCLGIFLGGVIMKKYKLDIMAATKLAFIASFVGFLTSLLYVTVGCENNTVAGLTVTYDGQPVSQHAVSLTSACNVNCTCPADQWDPVCGNNGITYISACFAGCKTITGSRRETVLHNCSCITETESSMKNSSAVLGECQKSDECSRNLIYFIVIKVVSLFFYALGGTPFYMITIRCVHKELKALAVGLYMLILRTLGGIPSPVYFGAVIDMACLKWARKSCGQRGACMFYDSKKFRVSYFGLIFGLRMPSYLLGIVFFLLVKKHFGRKAADETENKKEETPLTEEVKPSAPEWPVDLSHEETDTHV